MKVILCVKMPSGSTSSDTTKSDATSNTPCVSIDPRRRQVTLVHPTPSRRRFSLTAPKMFAFDAVLTQDDALVSHRRFFFAPFSCPRGVTPRRNRQGQLFPAPTPGCILSALCVEALRFSLAAYFTLAFGESMQNEQLLWWW